jgi:uncharacterized protein (DUF1778 family)
MQYAKLGGDYIMNTNQLGSESYQITTLTTRVPLHLKQRWQHAANLRGLTLTDFLITAANSATGSIMEEEDRIQLSEKDALLLIKMLAEPVKPNKRLHKAVSEELKRMKNS